MAAEAGQGVGLAVAGVASTSKPKPDVHPEMRVKRVEAISRLHASFHSGSRLQVLQSLSARNHSNPHNLSMAIGTQPSDDKFQLQLAPPRL